MTEPALTPLAESAPEPLSEQDAYAVLFERLAAARDGETAIVVDKKVAVSVDHNRGHMVGAILQVGCESAILTRTDCLRLSAIFAGAAVAMDD